MIITRTPFRVSFFGGGTDIPAWFRHEGGQVLSSTIDKYCYVTIRDLPPFFDHSIRLAYSKIETVCDPVEIQHPLIRTILADFDQNNVEVHYDADLPGNSGLGTSSSFGVGLTSALMALRGKLLSKTELANSAIRYERHLLKEPGGYQDQIAASFGGLNHIVFNRDDSYSVNPIPTIKQRRQELTESLLLCYIPISRFSGEMSLARHYDKKSHEQQLHFLYRSVDQAIDIFQNGDLRDFGELLHEAWQKKREFRDVTNPEIDEIYDASRAAGALGGKLLGAGGGGFMLLYCEKAHQEKVRQALDKLLFVPFELEQDGVQIIYYRP